MKICPQCHAAFWPYLIVLFIAGVTAFLTWLTLGYNDFDSTERIIAAIGMFLAVGATLTHYMAACMERHCRHREQAQSRRGKFGNRQRPVGV